MGTHFFYKFKLPPSDKSKNHILPPQCIILSLTAYCLHDIMSAGVWSSNSLDDVDQNKIARYNKLAF